MAETIECRMRARVCTYHVQGGNGFSDLAYTGDPSVHIRARGKHDLRVGEPVAGSQIRWGQVRSPYMQFVSVTIFRDLLDSG